MAKKKHNTIVNNIDSINVEIDYNKLAQAIVDAQNKSNNKSQRTNKLRSAALNFFNGAVYSMIYIVAGFSIYAVWAEVYTKQENSLIGCLVLSIVLAFIGVYAFLCQQESFRDKESETLEYFNVNISLIALVVALVALFKEVG